MCYRFDASVTYLLDVLLDFQLWIYDELLYVGKLCTPVDVDLEYQYNSVCLQSNAPYYSRGHCISKYLKLQHWYYASHDLFGAVKESDVPHTVCQQL